MDDRITIIEGPPPTFEQVSDGWALGLNEGPLLYQAMLTRLRTFNGEALVERCYRAWNRKTSIHLHYRNEIGMEEKVPILAARTLDSEEGPMILLWVRLQPEDLDVEIGLDDDLNDMEGEEGFDDDNTE